jgi:LPS export ABC transporter permease LptF
MIKTLDKYILREFIPFFLVGFAFLNTFFIINKMLEMMDLLIVKRVEVTTVLKLLLFMLPYTFAVTIPLSLLAATLMAFGRMSSDFEIIALLASGTSYWRMLRLPIILGLIFSLFMVFFNDKILPWGNFHFKKTYREVALKRPFSQLLEHRFVTIEGKTFGVGKIDEKNNILYDIIIYERDRVDGNLVVTSAQKGTWLKNTKVKDMNNNIYQLMRLQLQNGTVQSYEGGPSREFHVQTFQRMTINIRFRITEDISVDKSARELSIGELRQEILNMKKRGEIRTVSELTFEYHKKLAIPFASLSFILIGLGLAMIPKKAGIGYGLLMTVVIMFFYYLCLAMGEAYGKSGVINPALAVWFTDVLLAVVGGGILLRLSK